MQPIIIIQYTYFTKYGEVGACYSLLSLVAPRVHKLILGGDFVELHSEVIHLHTLGNAVPFLHGDIHVEVEAYPVSFQNTENGVKKLIKSIFKKKRR